MTAIQYLKHKDKIAYTPFIRSNGENFYKEDGVLIPEKEFQSKYPLPEKIRPESRRIDKGANPDKTKIVIY